MEDAPKPKIDFTKFFRNRKADGGAIGIEVLFEEKKPRKNFNIGGQAQKTNTTPYDPRASIMDYGSALDKVGAGTQSQKSKSLGQYAKNYFGGLTDAALNLSGCGGGITSLTPHSFNSIVNLQGQTTITGAVTDAFVSSGTVGQVLSSTGTSQIQWIDGSAAAGALQGSGTLNQIAKWTPS